MFKSTGQKKKLGMWHRLLLPDTFRWKEVPSTSSSSDVCGVSHKGGVVAVAAEGGTHTSGAEDVDPVPAAAFICANK